MEEKLRALYYSYVDACTMCTKLNCEKCCLNMVIEDLEKILNEEHR